MNEIFELFFSLCLGSGQGSSIIEAKFREDPFQNVVKAFRRYCKVVWKKKLDLNLLHKFGLEANSLILLRRRFLPYRNQSIDLHSKSLGWFLYERDLMQDRVNVPK